MPRLAARPRPYAPLSGFVACLAVCLAVAGGCGSTSAGRAGATAGPSSTDAGAYYPLAEGWKWAYDVSQDGQDILATYAVTSNDGTSATLRAGAENLVYKLAKDGIVRTDGAARDDYLLKSPVKEGARWPLRMGEAVIVAAGVSIDVPAGHFDGCVVVEETRIEPDRTSRTTYAPGVGPVLIEYRATEALAGSIQNLRAQLRGFTRPGEDPFAS